MATKAVSIETGPALAALKAALSPTMIPLVKNAFRAESLGYARETRDKLRANTPKLEGNLRKATKHKGTKGGGAKVYIDKSGGNSGRGFHWHLVQKGSKQRKTKKGANRGVMPAAPYINQVTDAAAQGFTSTVVPRVVARIRRKMESGK
jgi:hypothetical protein